LVFLEGAFCSFWGALYSRYSHALKGRRGRSYKIVNPARTAAKAILSRPSATVP
jgi:hypothetical protein